MLIPYTPNLTAKQFLYSFLVYYHSRLYVIIVKCGKSCISITKICCIPSSALSGQSSIQKHSLWSLLFPFPSELSSFPVTIRLTNFTTCPNTSKHFVLLVLKCSATSLRSSPTVFFFFWFVFILGFFIPIFFFCLKTS